MDEGEYRGPEPKQEPHPEPRRRQPRNLPLDFDDPTAAFGAKSTRELLLSWAVFSACQARSTSFVVQPCTGQAGPWPAVATARLIRHGSALWRSVCVLRLWLPPASVCGSGLALMDTVRAVPS